MLKQSILITVLSFSAGAVSLKADSQSTTREFRPLMAKKVAVELASRATHAADVDSVQSQAWAHFDARDWDAAIDKFLTVLEKDPASKAAGEGLAMSLYRSGDYGSAYRLGSELSEVMPEIRTVVSETVIADVRYMVKEGEFETAKEFLSHFPATDSLYTKAHTMLADANKISVSLGAETGAKPAAEAVGVAKN
ncbi:MAG: hypothetical protein P1U86_16130 [Verrucomicrobiales bacterium]|nr:hypothetical protein [Verrucomicrobiales bacterium]